MALGVVLVASKCKLTLNIDLEGWDVGLEKL